MYLCIDGVVALLICGFVNLWSRVVGLCSGDANAIRSYVVVELCICVVGTLCWC